MQSVTLSIYASDASTVDQMVISNSSDFAGASWESYTTTKAWTLTAGDETKTLYIKYKDIHGNESTIYTDTIQLDTTTPDIQGPTGSIEINSGAQATSSGTVALSIYADDTSGVDQMIISNYSDFAGSGWESYTTTKNWPLTNGDGIKTVYIKYKDTQGNESAVYSDNIILNTTSPTGTIAINSESAVTDNTLITLSISAQKETVTVSVYDSVYGEVCQTIQPNIELMKISDLIDMSTGSWEPYTTTKAWTLTGEDGTKNLYIKFKDSLGNESNTYSDSIILDTQAPTGTITINSGLESTLDQTVTLSIYASDTNGIGQMMISNYPDFNGAGWEIYATIKTWTLTDANGTKIVYIKYKDAVGKESTVYTNTITLNVPPPPQPEPLVIDKEGPVAPAVNIPTGIYNNVQSIKLTTAIDSANTYYTLDGTEPDNTKTRYTGSITIDGADGQIIALKAVSYDIVGNKGAVITQIYTFDKEGPTAPATSLADGIYNKAQTITLNPAKDAVSTYYTIDGTEPNNSTKAYTSPITIDGQDGQSITLKTVSYDNLSNKGKVKTQTYTFDKIAPLAPTIKPAGGTYTTAQNVTLTPSEEGVKTYYTLDGTEPDSTNIQYTGKAIVIDANIGKTIILKVVSYDAVGNKGTIKTETYMFEKEEGQITTKTSETTEDQTNPTQPTDPQGETEISATEGAINETETLQTNEALVNSNLEDNTSNSTNSNNVDSEQYLYSWSEDDIIKNETSGGTIDTSYNSSTSLILGSTKGLSGTTTYTEERNEIGNINQTEEFYQKQALEKTQYVGATIVGTAVLGAATAGVIAVVAGGIGTTAGVSAAGAVAAGAVAVGTGSMGAATAATLTGLSAAGIVTTAGTAGTTVAATAGTAAAGSGATGSTLLSSIADILRRIIAVFRKISRYKNKIYRSYRRVEKLKRGINLTYSLNLGKFSDKRIKDLKKTRFTFVRINVNLEKLFDSIKFNTQNNSQYENIQNFISRILKQRLAVSLKLNLDKTFISKLNSDPKFEEKALLFCESLMDQLKRHNKNRMFIEVPFVGEISEKYIKIIRKILPKCTIILSDIKINNLSNMQKPQFKNIIYNLDIDNITIDNVTKIRKIIKKSYKWSNKNKIPLIATVKNTEDKLWLKKVRITLKRYVIGWSIGNYSALKDVQLLKALKLRKNKQ